MKILRLFILFLVISVIITGCRKEDKPVYSGTMTIDNELFGNPYYAYGLSVPTGKKVSTLESPLDVMTVNEDHDISYNLRKIFFSSSNLFKNAFYRFGTYPNGTSAQQAFDALLSFSTPIWSEMGDSVKANQIWLFRTNEDKFAKIRVISTFTEKRVTMANPYVECTFQWVFQPDGTQTFPGK
jgi:hypothetical protein